MPPKSYRPLPSERSLSPTRFYPTGVAQRRDQFFRRSAHQGGIAERKAMIDREHDLSITKQAEILKISRGSVYYLPRPVSSADLEIMRQLDRLHLEYPFAGSRMLRGLLALQGCKVGRRHVKTLMRRMGIEALYRRPRAPPSPSPATRSIRICCAAWRLRVQTRSGPWTSPTFRWRTASSISPWCWTGRHVVFCPGGCRSRWRRPSASRHWRMLSRVMAGRKSSTPTRARSLPVRPLPAFSPTTASPSAWMAKELGETTYSLRGCGRASNTRRSICEPTKQSARHEARLVGISTFTTGDDRIRVLTTAPRIKPTSIFLRSARRLNPGRGSTYRRGDSVQTTGTSSLQHRIRNLLTVVQCFVNNTEASTANDYRVALMARIVNLSDAYNLIESARENRVSLAELLERTLMPHATFLKDRIFAAGPDIVLEPRLALSLHMIFHELATNASKHGALASTSGAVEVLWDVRSDGGDHALAVQWREHGGPEVRKPRHKGFGLRLISKVLSGAQVEMDFAPTGLLCRLLVEIDPS